MILKALLVLALDVALVGAAAAHLAGSGSEETGSLLSGAGLGLLCALSAVLGAAWAHLRDLGPRQALSVVVVGTLGRMVLLGLWAGIGFSRYQLQATGFLAGFAALFLVGQGLEVWLLTRKVPRAAADDQRA